MGVSPGFAEANPLQKRYTPCPLYLAASAGHQDAVELFCQLDSCPHLCERDAYLLLAARNCELRRQLLITDDHILELWDRALSFSEESSLVANYQQPIAEYRFRTEIKSREELQDLWYTRSLLPEHPSSRTVHGHPRQGLDTFSNLAGFTSAKMAGQGRQNFSGPEP